MALGVPREDYSARMAAPSTGLWPPVGGETSALIRARDWSASPLGLPHTWPPELKTAVGIMLGSPRPIAIYWGPEFICLYNDAYGGLLREKHPAALGRPLREVFPTADTFGFPDEISAFGLQFAHGLGLALHERPIISRVISMDHPTEIKEGMVFAIETYCPATDGASAARIEEEVVVTDKGCRLISLFPAEELPIANRY